MTQPKIEGVGHGVPRTIFGSDGEHWYAILVDSDGHVKIDVVSAALPTDAATETTLGAIKTAAQLIDDLRNALGSVNTDDLQVDIKTYPGSNALGNFPFGYYDIYLELITELNATTGTNVLLGTEVPSGEVWVVTSIVGVNGVSDPTSIRLGIRRSSIYYTIFEKLSPGINVRVSLNVPMYLKAGDKVFGIFYGCVLNDDLYLTANGYKMKVA